MVTGVHEKNTRHENSCHQNTVQTEAVVIYQLSCLRVLFFTNLSVHV